MGVPMSNKFLNIKVGVEFYKKLMTQPSFQKNWKAISPAYYFVRRIADLNDMKDGEPAEFYSGTIADIFQPYTKGRYVEYLTALESLQILENNHASDYPANPHGKLKAGESGYCHEYRVTDLGCQLLHSGNMEYLKKLKSEPELKRANQKSISNRKVMHKTYDDPVLDYTYDGLKNISFDQDKAEQMISKSCWSDAQKRNVSNGLRSFEEKDFSELKFNLEDGRVYHELIQLKSDARVLLKYKHMPYRAFVDIRCCHPTFFSPYIITHPSTLHYIADNQDKAVVLEQEHLKWIQLFCNPVIDPKEEIRKVCRFKDTAHAKRAMNESLNGSKVFLKTFLKWLQREFPMLYVLWQKTDVKHTGNGISKKFEHPLIQNKNLCDLADTLGIKIQSEHDGFGVFACEDDAELENKLKCLAAHIQSCSVKLFGVSVVVKFKIVPDWSNFDLLAEMTHKRGELEKEYAKLKPRWDRLRRKCPPRIKQPASSLSERH